MKTKILGIPIDTYTKKEALQKLLEYLETDKNNLLITPNPEIIMEALKDEEFSTILKNAEMVIPDGIGVVIASKFNKVKIKERVAGCDLILELFDNIKNTDKTVYLFGAKPTVALKAKELMEKKYKGLKIIGVADGYFDHNKEILIIEEIKRLKPDILLVGLGLGKQEKWIAKYQNELPVHISAGIGGSIDVMAGEVKRAPIYFQKLGLEWFYRLLKQPSRIGRMAQLPLFMVKVIISKIKGNNCD